MKAIFKICACLFAICLMNACTKDENKVYFQGGTAPVLSAATGSDVSFANASLTALTLTWTNPDYKFNTGVSSLDVTYNIEIDTAADFSNPAKKVIAVSKNLSYSMTVSELNDIMLNQLQLKAKQPHNLVMRVLAGTASGTGKLTSNSAQFTATPYSIPPKVEPPSSNTLYITGAATPGNWQCGCGEAELTSQKFIQQSETLYTLPSIQLTGGQSYTFVPVYGSWSAKYSIKTKNDPNEVNGGTFQVGGEDILAPAATGNYKIDVDFQRGVFTVTKL